MDQKFAEIRSGLLEIINSVMAGNLKVVTTRFYFYVLKHARQVGDEFNQLTYQHGEEMEDDGPDFGQMDAQDFLAAFSSTFLPKYFGKEAVVNAGLGFVLETTKRRPYTFRAEEFLTPRPIEVEEMGGKKIDLSLEDLRGLTRGSGVSFQKLVDRNFEHGRSDE